MNADTIINKVDFGKWKLVTMALAILNSCGGKTNLFVHPSKVFNMWSDDTALSRPRMAVVPTAQILRLFRFALLTISVAFSSIINSSLSILCLERSSTSTGLKVPRPTCNVNSAKLIPLFPNASKDVLKNGVLR